MARKLLNEIGNTYGRLTVISKGQGYYCNKKGKTDKMLKETTWVCKCECGRTVEITRTCLLSAKSCGCIIPEIISKSSFKHGGCINNITAPEYTAWTRLKDRCLNPNSKEYKNYGARGITVCNRWLNSYSNFIEDIGKRPSPKHSIDRMDNNGNYEPSNCRWATIEQQNQNTRRTKLSPALVAQIRRLSERGYTFKELGNLFNCSERTISAAVKYQAWKNIPDTEPFLLVTKWSELLIIYQQQIETNS